MTHQQIIAFIRSISNSVNSSGQFFYAKENVASVHSYDGDFPLICLVSARWRKDRRTKNIFWDLLIFFGDRDSLSSNPQEGMNDDPNLENQESIVNRMYILADQFEDALENSTSPVIELTSISGRRDDHRFMADLTGCFVQYTISTKKQC